MNPEDEQLEEEFLECIMGDYKLTEFQKEHLLKCLRNKHKKLSFQTRRGLSKGERKFIRDLLKDWENLKGQLKGGVNE